MGRKIETIRPVPGSEVLLQMLQAGDAPCFQQLSQMRDPWLEVTGGIAQPAAQQGYQQQCPRQRLVQIVNIASGKTEGRIEFARLRRRTDCRDAVRASPTLNEVLHHGLIVDMNAQQISPITHPA